MSATGFHPEPSAKAPWTRTIVLTAAYAGDDAARAAPVRRARIKRFMVKLRQCSLQRPTRDVSRRRAGRRSRAMMMPPFRRREGRAGSRDSDPAWGPPSRHGAPDQQQNHGSHDRADETGALAGVIPAKRLPEESRDDGADDAENGRQHETGRLVFAGRDQLRDNARDEPDDDGPDDAH